MQSNFTNEIDKKKYCVNVNCVPIAALIRRISINVAFKAVECIWYMTNELKLLFIETLANSMKLDVNFRHSFKNLPDVAVVFSLSVHI